MYGGRVLSTSEGTLAGCVEPPQPAGKETAAVTHAARRSRARSMVIFNPSLAPMTRRAHSSRRMPMVLLAAGIAAFLLAPAAPARAVPAIACGPITVKHTHYH